jgi:hypothetical protein
MSTTNITKIKQKQKQKLKQISVRMHQIYQTRSKYVEFTSHVHKGA